MLQSYYIDFYYNSIIIPLPSNSSFQNNHLHTTAGGRGGDAMGGRGRGSPGRNHVERLQMPCISVLRTLKESAALRKLPANPLQEQDLKTSAESVPGNPFPDRHPEGPSTQQLRSLVPRTIPQKVAGTRILKYWVLGPSGPEKRET